MNPKGSSVYESCNLCCSCKTLQSLIPSGATVAEVAGESRAGNSHYDLIRYCFRESGCTTTESTVVVFLCDESDLQVRNLNRICCGNEIPGCNGRKAVSDTE